MLRYLMVNGVNFFTTSDFPYGTLIVNIIGGLLMGAWVATLPHIAPAKVKDLHLLLAVGLLGGFTTFSAFTLDVFLLMKDGLAVQATLYILGSVMLSLVALLAGMYLVKLAIG
jgi:CrcB protein